MAVKIRLARRGRKKLALFDVVVADARSPRDGRFIEKIGTYNPNTNPATVTINSDRALAWLKNGAQPTDSVRRMLSYRGVLLRRHLQIGVDKGAITQEVADARFAEWVQKKDAQIVGKVDNLKASKADAMKARLVAEAEKKEARAKAVAEKQAEALRAAEAASAETITAEIGEEASETTEEAAPAAE